MARLVYTTMASLDGYVEDAHGSFDWSMPDEEVLRFINDGERPIGTYLYGRRLYQTMLYWETALAAPDHSPTLSDEEREFTKIWQAADKIVFSRVLPMVSSAHTRLEREFSRDLVLGLKESSERDLSVGGAQLAAEALLSGVVDEVRLLLHPLTLGAGKPALPGGVRLRLVEQQDFTGGMVFLRYAVQN